MGHIIPSMKQSRNKIRHSNSFLRGWTFSQYIMPFLNSVTIRLSLSLTIRFWKFCKLLYFEHFWHFHILSSSDTFKFSHFQILSLSASFRSKVAETLSNRFENWWPYVRLGILYGNSKRGHEIIHLSKVNGHKIIKKTRKFLNHDHATFYIILYERVLLSASLPKNPGIPNEWTQLYLTVWKDKWHLPA